MSSDLAASEALADRLNRSLEAMAECIKIAAEQGAVAGVEFIADYLNDIDAVEEEDLGHFEKWKAAGRP